MQADSISKALRDAEKCVELAPKWSKGSFLSLETLISHFMLQDIVGSVLLNKVLSASKLLLILIEKVVVFDLKLIDFRN
jgi:hypothetical protein